MPRRARVVYGATTPSEGSSQARRARVVYGATTPSEGSSQARRARVVYGATVSEPILKALNSKLADKFSRR